MLSALASKVALFQADKFCHVGNGDTLTVVCQNVAREILEASTSRPYAQLWALAVPKGNIYRYNSFCQEFLRHREDINRQLDQLADDDDLRRLLGDSADERRAVIRQTWRAAMPTFTREDSGQHPQHDYLPAMEFVGAETVRKGPFVMPAHADEQSVWIKNNLIGVSVCVVQVIAPLLILSDSWNDDRNWLRDAWHHLTFKEALCPGKDLRDSLTTVLGVLFLVLILMVIRRYAENESENAQKDAILPLSPIWVALGLIANAVSVIATTIAAPLFLWVNESPSEIVLSSLGICFLLSLDDLNGNIILLYLGVDDEDFQRSVAYQLAILAQTPIDLSDLVNLNATNAEELWHIHFDAEDRLTTSNGAKCMTRLQQLDFARELRAADSANFVHSASVRLVANSERLVARNTFHYCTSPESAPMEMPRKTRNTHCIREFFWQRLILLLSILQYVIPSAWFVMNRPCYS